MRMRLGLGVLVGATIAGACLVPAAGSFLVVADPLPPAADAIVVLAGSVRDRSLEAADLYRRGIAPQVIVTREALPPGALALRAEGVDLPESDALVRAALMGLGVPPRAIVTLRRRAESTASEARTIARWACRRGVRGLVVVTSPTHTRRARLVLARALGPEIALTIRPATADTFGGRRWFRVRRDAKAVLAEWQRLLHHWLRERWTLGPAAGCDARGRRPAPETG